MNAEVEYRDLYAFDAAFAAEREVFRVAGADEAGRGAFAGPLFAAAVVLGGEVIEGINDSKVLGEASRERLFAEVISCAEAISVSSYPAWWIDQYGVGVANREALSNCLDMVSGRAGCLLADGRLRLGGVTSLPKADSLSAAVASASIVAKVLRDHTMRELSTVYPDYGFERNKGYGTQAHRDVLREVGACRVHRFSYSGVE